MLVPPAKQEGNKVVQVRFKGSILQPAGAKLSPKAELVLAQVAVSLAAVVGVTSVEVAVMSAVGATSAAGWLL